MNAMEEFIFEATKEIVIAKLSNSAPNKSDEIAGKAIGEMFEQIYKKLLDIANKDN